MPAATPRSAACAPTTPSAPPRWSAARRRCSRRDFFAARAGWGDPAPDPIFIVGLPRSGSTLVEQILASHPAVEGTRELMDIQAMADWAAAPGAGGPTLPRSPSLPRGGLRQLGHDYLARTRAAAPPRPPALHRQGAVELPAHRPDPADAAQRADRRRAPPPARLLRLGLQAALRRRLRLRLRPRPTSAATTPTMWT